MTEIFHRPEVAAKQFGITLQAFYAACREQKIPHIRIGKRIRVPESALQRWIEEQLGKNTNAQTPATSLTARN